MSCASFDLKAYQFGEATAAERRGVEQHARSCEACAAELARLNLTQATLMMGVREEEMPRRIAFVSDKVFEPKWYQRFWRPVAPAWGFLSAAALAGAIVFHAVWHPGTIVVPNPMASVVRKSPAPAGLSRAVVESLVRDAVAEADARSEKRARQLLVEMEKRTEMQRVMMMAAMDANTEYLLKKYNNLYKMTASADTGAGR